MKYFNTLLNAQLVLITPEKPACTFVKSIFISSIPPGLVPLKVLLRLTGLYYWYNSTGRQINTGNYFAFISFFSTFLTFQSPCCSHCTSVKALMCWVDFTNSSYSQMSWQTLTYQTHFLWLLCLIPLTSIFPLHHHYCLSPPLQSHSTSLWL